MNYKALITLVFGLFFSCDSRSYPNDTASKDAVFVDYEVKDVVIPSALHAQNLAVPAKLFVPHFSKPSISRPAILVLHGSGGLFQMPEDLQSNAPCSPILEPQFERWGKRLAELGYVVLMPASFDARGFCDFHEDQDRIPKDFLDDQQRLLGRLYDTDAASQYLCELPEVDCQHLGLLGFSHGASAAMLSLHWQLASVTNATSVSPTFQLGIAYYPGCGFEGLVPFDTSSTTPSERMYFSTAELFIEHGSADSLINDCSTEYGQGRRQIQSSLVAGNSGETNTYHIQVYDGASHSFDNVDDQGNENDIYARDAALAATLENFQQYLGE